MRSSDRPSAPVCSSGCRTAACATWRLVHGRALATALPRGNYRISLTGGLYGLAQPLLLSRSQVVVVPVVTWLDLLVVGGGLLVVALGLVLVGRPHLARRAGARVVRRRGSATRQVEQA